ncbi:MAG: phosphohydrolase, partial [Desulfuromonas sp.]
MEKLDLLEKIELLNAIGINLSIEKDHDQLLESILKGAMKITCADAGSLYLLKDDALHFEIVLGNSMGIAMGGKSGNPVTMNPVPLHDENGEPNRRNVVSCAALDNAIINVEDAYDSEDYDFTGTRKFDQATGFRSKSFLSVPMSDHEDQLIGVLQLINATDPENGGVIPFDLADEKLVSSLTSQAAVALTRKNLIDGLENLLQSLVKLVATAIDEKSPYTGGHCKRVPELTMLLAAAVNEAEEGTYAGVALTEDQLHELEMAAWLHDCGKITTPEYVVDKRTKLETIFDRIDLVDTRIEVLRRDAKIAGLQNNPPGDSATGESVDVASRLQELEEIRTFLRKANTGGEFLPPEEGQKIRALAERFTVEMADGSQQPLLSENETENLCIVKGTLTDAEREMIQNHIVATINMLESLPFPKHLRNIP